MLSVQCSATESLFDLKHKIASQLDVDWSAHQQHQQLVLMSRSSSAAADSDHAHGCLRGDDTQSLQSLDIHDGDVLAVLIEDLVRNILNYLFCNFVYLSFSSFTYRLLANR